MLMFSDNHTLIVYYSEGSAGFKPACYSFLMTRKSLTQFSCLATSPDQINK